MDDLSSQLGAQWTQLGYFSLGKAAEAINWSPATSGGSGLGPAHDPIAFGTIVNGSIVSTGG